jgi:esterase/lipase
MKKLILALIWLTFSFSYSQNENVKKTEVDVNSLIKGTLFYAENTEKKPNLVILIAGSGPTDRNGNQKATGENNSLKFLAESITDQKTSVFSYDKRILQQLKMGTVDEKSARFDDLLTDACDVFNYFKSQNTYGKIYFAGHSEGSLVGMVASNTAKANGFISLAGPGRPIDVVLAEQIAKNASILEEDSKVILAALKRGETVKITNPFLTSLFRESVQPYLISWMKYNPQEEIQKLNIPILIINGTKDLQVPAQDAELLHTANPKSELALIENMNHIFKEIINDDDNLKSYSNPDLPVMKQLVDAMTNFIQLH